MNLRLLLFIAMFTITIGGIGVDLYSPSLPWIAQYMHANHALAKYTITIFLIGFSLGQIFFGVMSDVHGRRNTLSYGVAFFAASSLAAAFSPTIYVLMIFRFIQGLSAASCSVIAKSLIVDSFKGDELKKSMASTTVAWGIGPIVAPLIGGYLQHHYNWQANFYFYAAYSFVLFLVIVFFLKETLKNKLQFSFKGFLHHYAELFKHRVFFSGAIGLGLSYSLIIAFNVMGPFIIQTELKYSAIVFGHSALIVGLAYFLGSAVSRYLLKYFSSVGLIRFSVLLLNLVGVAYVVISYFITTSLVSVVLSTFLIILGVGLIFPNLLSISMSFFVSISGIAGSLLGCVVYLTTTLASSAFGWVHLANERPYAWTLLSIVFALSALVLLRFLPGVRSVQEASS